jgi:hypothetical protein
VRRRKRSKEAPRRQRHGVMTALGCIALERAERLARLAWAHRDRERRDERQPPRTSTRASPRGSRMGQIRATASSPPTP